MANVKPFKCPDCGSELNFTWNNDECGEAVCDCGNTQYIEDYWQSWVECYICHKDYCMDHDETDQRNAFMKRCGFKNWYLCFSCELFDVDCKTCEHYTEIYGLSWEMFRRKKFCKEHMEYCD